MTTLAGTQQELVARLEVSNTRTHALAYGRPHRATLSHDLSAPQPPFADHVRLHNAYVARPNAMAPL